jgi:molybdopterin-synthase adenylyltransferase
MPLRSITIRAQRGEQEFLLAPQESLYSWAAAHGLSLRQAIEAALEAGIFPECFERNFPSLTPAEQLTLWRSLNRQLLATAKTLGQNKAVVTARHLREINAALIAEAIPEFLDQENLRKFLPLVQVLLDAMDTLTARRDLINTARQFGVPVVHGAVSGAFGQVTTILPQDPGGLPFLFPAGAPPAPETAPGVLAPTVTLVASLQVQEAIRLLLGKKPAYHGALAHCDGDTGRLETLPLG